MNIQTNLLKALILFPTFILGMGPETQNKLALTAEQQKALNEQLVDAAWADKTQTVRTLLAQGAHVDAQAEHNKATAIMKAADYGYIETIKVLLAKGANLNLRDKYGWSALMNAIVNNKPEVVKAFLMHKNGTEFAISNAEAEKAVIVDAKMQYWPHDSLIKLVQNLLATRS